MTTRLLSALALLCLLSSATWAASVSLCENSSAASKRSMQMYGPAGQLLTLSIGDEPPVDVGCEQMDLPLPAADIHWFSLTEIARSPEAPATLALQGYFRDTATVVSEVIHDQTAATEPVFIPFNENILPYLRAQAFGSEERASLDISGLLRCTAGEQVAGIKLSANAVWEQLPGMELELAGNSSAVFAIAIADAEHDRDDTPLLLGELTPAASDTPYRLPLPDSTQRWNSLTILCPAHAATLQLHSITQRFRASPVLAHGRSTWLWSPDLWLSSRERVWELVQREGLQKLYVTVPVDASGTLAQPADLADFIREARTRGIDIWAVLGDPADVLPRNLPLLLQRAEAYRRYNRDNPQQRIAGLQLDIEPYLLPGITLAPDYWRDRYISSISAVHAQLAQELPLDLVVPVWWGTHPAWGTRLLDALAKPGISLTVMNYRTNASALRAGAMPFLAWGETNALAVTMALEAGRIGVVASPSNEAETRRQYVATQDDGELWLLPLGDMNLLLLLDTARADLPGQAYVNVDERVINISNISFSDNRDAMRSIAEQLVAEWSHWGAFAGLAIHGLDQFDDDKR